MRKKLIALVMAVVTVTALDTIAMARFDTFYSTYIPERNQYWRTFTSETRYKEKVDLITAGIQCLRVDTGEQVGEGGLSSAENSDITGISETFTYSAFPMEIRACGSHSAYKNGKAVVFEFTTSDKA